MSIHPDVLAAKNKRQADLKVAREYRKACGPKKKLPPTLAGQLADVLREHFARALPGHSSRRKRNGDRLPLSAWMLGTGAHCKSKIMAVVSSQAHYPYSTQKASSYVLADRIAARHGITSAQTSCLYEYVNSRYNGRLDGREPVRYLARMDRDLFQASLDALKLACSKYHLNISALPLRAILDPQVTNILLLIQLNALIQHKKLSH